MHREQKPTLYGGLSMSQHFKKIQCTYRQAGHLIWESHFPIIDTISLDQILRVPIDTACGFGLYEW